MFGFPENFKSLESYKVTEDLQLLWLGSVWGVEGTETQRARTEALTWTRSLILKHKIAKHYHGVQKDTNNFITRENKL